MIKIITDNSFIYTLLEHAEQLPNDFTLDKVLAFDLEDDFCLVLYTSADRNFVCFKTINYLQESNTLIDLQDKVQEYFIDTINATQINESLQIIENKIHSKNSYRFYFDAH